MYGNNDDDGIITDCDGKNALDFTHVQDSLPILGIERFCEKMEILIRLEGFWKFPASKDGEEMKNHQKMMIGNVHDCY